MNRNELRRLARIRLREVRVLMKARCFDGAYYLCGYAVECGLKACIAKHTRKSEFPDLDRVKGSYTHSLPALVKTAGLEDHFRDEEESNERFGDYWQIVRDWSESSRYAEHEESKARVLHEAVTNPRHGVMRWIRRH